VGENASPWPRWMGIRGGGGVNEGKPRVRFIQEEKYNFQGKAGGPRTRTETLQGS
jgi:hypothetical protein